MEMVDGQLTATAGTWVADRQRVASKAPLDVFQPYFNAVRVVVSCKPYPPSNAIHSIGLMSYDAIIVLKISQEVVAISGFRSSPLPRQPRRRKFVTFLAYSWRRLNTIEEDRGRRWCSSRRARITLPGLLPRRPNARPEDPIRTPFKLRRRKHNLRSGGGEDASLVRSSLKSTTPGAGPLADGSPERMGASRTSFDRRSRPLVSSLDDNDTIKNCVRDLLGVTLVEKRVHLLKVEEKLTGDGHETDRLIHREAHLCADLNISSVARLARKITNGDGDVMTCSISTSTSRGIFLAADHHLELLRQLSAVNRQSSNARNHRRSSSLNFLTPIPSDLPSDGEALS
ncbi:hypothetical protein SCHPADRAFT_895395 [Schizopora paradoxa]|uniref:Uncharacterized protein n=1 Tax=Schizopora paradoxa TaxID=27342 RepID=A0A0H2RAH7_9AGAM|nr:hypothetical protein SCHPADRAFT_895395 [Schizopora paradoxa]